jgi:hypothetical protein
MPLTRTVPTTSTLTCFFSYFVLIIVNCKLGLPFEGFVCKISQKYSTIQDHAPKKWTIRNILKMQTVVFQGIIKILPTLKSGQNIEV